MKSFNALLFLLALLLNQSVIAQEISGYWNASIYLNTACQWTGALHFDQADNPGVIEGFGSITADEEGGCFDNGGTILGSIDGNAVEFIFPVGAVVESQFVATLDGAAMSGTWQTLTPGFGGTWTAVKGNGFRRGPFIISYEKSSVLYLVSNGLVAIHGFDVLGGICESGTLYTDTFEFKDIDNPGVWGSVLSQMKGEDIDTWIYPSSVFNNAQNPTEVDWERTCEILRTEPDIAIAEGTVKVVSTENAGLGLSTGDPVRSQRSSTYHMSAQGNLWSPTMDRVNYSGQIRCTRTENYDPDRSQRCKTSINIRD